MPSSLKPVFGVKPATGDPENRPSLTSGDSVYYHHPETGVAHHGVVAAVGKHGFTTDADGGGEHAAMARHSKTGAAFTPGDRAREHAEAMAAHRDEIEKVEAWALVIAERAGIALELKAPLLP